METFKIKVAGEEKTFELGRTLFVFVDCQNDFITGALGSEDAVKAYDNVLKIASLKDLNYVAVTMDTHYYDYNDTLEGKYLPVPHCQIGTEGWMITPELKEKFRELRDVEYFEKELFGSAGFGNYCWYLENSEEIDCIVFCGFCTDICVINNVLIAKTGVKNIPLVVVEDACSGVTAEKHRAALEVMNSCQVEVVKFNDIFQENR